MLDLTGVRLALPHANFYGALVCERKGQQERCDMSETLRATHQYLDQRLVG
jgi:hypothetical protein